MPTTLPKDNTKIQLKTKISSAEDKSLSDIALDVGEPLVNTNDKTLVIGTANNKNADDDSAIVLGAGKLVVNSTSESTEDATTALSNGNVHINHIENNKALSSHKISGDRSVKVRTDANADIIVSADFALSSPAGITTNGVPVNLTDVENNSTHGVNIKGTEAVKVYSTTANEILVSADFTLASEESISASTNKVAVTLTDANRANHSDTFEIKGGKAVKATSDASGNITLSADFELYTDKSAAATNGVTVYLRDVEKDELKESESIDSFNIKGSGATAVTSDEYGNININTEYSLTATQQTGKDANASNIKLAGLKGNDPDDIVTIMGGDSTGITTASNIITISDTASYQQASVDDNASNLEYITEVTQSGGQISAKKKTLQGINQISITTDAEGKTTVADVANVTDTTYTNNDSNYVAKVTQTNGTIAYEKHTIEGGDNISVSTSEGKTTITNTASCTDDTAQNNKYISAITQQKGAITEIGRRNILEPTESETSKTIPDGDVVVITSAVPPTGNDGIILKNRKIKGDKGIEVIVGNSTSDITVQHTHTDITEKTTTSQTSNNAKITNGGTFTISDVNYDAQGHVTGETTATLTVPKYSEGTGISISQVGTTNEYTITNSASVSSTANNTDNSTDYIVSVSGSNGSVTPTKKVLTAGTGITITTGTGSTDAEKTKLTIGHSNLVTAKESYTGISTGNDASVNIVTPTYDAQGHVTGTANQNLTVGAASTTKLGTVRAGYTDSGANIGLQVSDGDAYITLTENAIIAAGGLTGITAGTGLSSSETSGVVTLNVNPGTGIQIPSDDKVTLKTASTSEIGGIKIYQDNSSYTVEAKTSSISKNVSTDNYRAVEIDKNDKAFVYVPSNLSNTVKQNKRTDNADAPILLATIENDNGETRYCEKVFVNLQEGKLTAQKFNAASDVRLKENFEPLVVKRSILDLPTYKFDFINGPKNQIGCKAQDLQEICPEIVDENSDGYLSIQESKIVYLLLEEVKKLKAEIEILKGRG